MYVNIFKHLWNHWADWSQISCGASLGWGDETVQVTWQGWPPCPYMVKTLKNFLSDIKTLYVASGARVLPSLFKWVPGLTLTYFTARSNLVPYAFVWEKGKTMDISEIFVVYDVKVGRCSWLNEYMNLYEYQRSRSFIDLGPRSHRFNIFKLIFPRNR